MIKQSERVSETGRVGAKETERERMTEWQGEWGREKAVCCTTCLTVPWRCAVGEGSLQLFNKGGRWEKEDEREEEVTRWEKVLMVHTARTRQWLLPPVSASLSFYQSSDPVPSSFTLLSLLSHMLSLALSSHSQTRQSAVPRSHLRLSLSLFHSCALSPAPLIVILQLRQFLELNITGRTQEKGRPVRELIGDPSKDSGVFVLFRLLMIDLFRCLSSTTKHIQWTRERKKTEDRLLCLSFGS